MKDSRPDKHNPITKLTPEIMTAYASGNLSEDMMEEVRRYLEDNPFEAEAMEGLLSNSVSLSQEMDDFGI